VGNFSAVAPAMDATAVADTNDPRAIANAAKVMTVIFYSCNDAEEGFGI
jgi:hypothetical protein